jgi:hypothetical protein
MLLFMQKIITLIFVYCAAISESFCLVPCMTETYFNINIGYFYPTGDTFYRDWQLGGPSIGGNHHTESFYLGFGFQHKDFPQDIYYGIDISYYGINSRIYNSKMTNVIGINNLKDSININTTASSSLYTTYLIISPKFGYYFSRKSPFILSLHPQLLIRMGTEVENIYYLSDTNFTSFAGNPKIEKDQKNNIIKKYNRNRDDTRKIDFNLVVSLEYQFLLVNWDRDCGCGCCPSFTKCSIRPSALIGFSLIAKRGLIIYPGLSLEFTFPLYGPFAIQ